MKKLILALMVVFSITSFAYIKEDLDMALRDWIISLSWIPTYHEQVILQSKEDKQVYEAIVSDATDQMNVYNNLKNATLPLNQIEPVIANVNNLAEINIDRYLKIKTWYPYIDFEGGE
jgi:hypothetical protein